MSSSVRVARLIQWVDTVQDSGERETEHFVQRATLERVERAERDKDDTPAWEQLSRVCAWAAPLTQDILLRMEPHHLTRMLHLVNVCLDAVLRLWDALVPALSDAEYSTDHKATVAGRIAVMMRIIAWAGRSSPPEVNAVIVGTPLTSEELDVLSEIELMSWQTACRLDLVLRFVLVQRASSFLEVAAAAAAELAIREPRDWMLEATFECTSRDAANCLPDIYTLWRMLSLLVSRWRFIESYEPQLTAYLKRIYDRLCVLVAYAEPNSAVRTPKGYVFEARRLVPRLLFDGARRIFSNPMFYRSNRAARVRTVNKTFLRETLMVFRGLSREITVRSALPSVAPVAGVPTARERLAFVRWCQRMSSSNLEDQINSDGSRRLFQLHLEPVERERFQREDRFGDPTAYSVIARYRAADLDAIMRWQDMHPQVVKRLLARAEHRIMRELGIHSGMRASKTATEAAGDADFMDIASAAGQKRPAADDLVLGDVAATAAADDDDNDGVKARCIRWALLEQLAVDVVIKFIFDTGSGAVGAMTRCQFERHRIPADLVAEAARERKRTPGGGVMMLQFLNRYEVCVDGTRVLRADGLDPAGVFLLWLRTKFTQPPPPTGAVPDDACTKMLRELYHEIYPPPALEGADPPPLLMQQQQRKGRPRSKSSGDAAAARGGPKYVQIDF
jgi:hypothetical protein